MFAQPIQCSNGGLNVAKKKQQPAVEVTADVVAELGHYRDAYERGKFGTVAPDDVVRAAVEIATSARTAYQYPDMADTQVPDIILGALVLARRVGYSIEDVVRLCGVAAAVHAELGTKPHPAVPHVAPHTAPVVE